MTQISYLSGNCGSLSNTPPRLPKTPAPSTEIYFSYFNIMLKSFYKHLKFEHYFVFRKTRLIKKFPKPKKILGLDFGFGCENLFGFWVWAWV